MNEYARGTSAEGQMAEEVKYLEKILSSILYTTNPTGTILGFKLGLPISISGQSVWDL